MQDLLSSLQPFSRCQIAVVGDLMLDEYLWGHIERISPEAPVPILNVIRRESMLGGAGNVVENLRALGAQVAAFGVVGNDKTGEQVRDLLNLHGADTTGVVLDPDRKSTRKARLMSLEHGQQVFRLDEESTHPVSFEVENRLVNAIRGSLSSAHAIVCSDYMKGVLTQRVLGAAFETARELGIPSITGPKDSNWRKYQGAAVLMPNSRELAQLVGTPVDGDVWLNESARTLIENLALEALVVTRGCEGMSLFESVRASLRRVDVPTTARSVFDVTGAGDTAIATFAAAIALRCSRQNAVHLANLAAGIKVGKRGSACVSLQELQQCIREEGTGSRELRSEIHAEPDRSAPNVAGPRASRLQLEMSRPRVGKGSF
jgi:D-beta-D-heptose 7-phosphate kinase/D-beta-D-heptose 1-phosphate adenosyltransferase